MDSYDRDVMRFVLAWAPYGGPREDEVWVSFGISVEQLGERFADAVTRCRLRAAVLPESDRQLLARAWAHLHPVRRDGHSAERALQERALRAPKGA
ncbi:hypothetical protein [Mycolicibacterium goodii]|uniref:DUF3263 domain-containing protein n=1 Tax=Mycolicibacterium goodii TaxID=134601 RepID=A0A0K0X3C8_MYCGD|nr:hypothetical protein AFA91_08180 [Mycolicibacterium goodii]